MFDFRYHALSLVSVFLALVLGLLLGVAIGDRGLVSSAERDVRASLRADVRKAQRESDAKSAAIAQQDNFLKEAYPLMVGGRLSGERVGILALGDVTDDEVGNIRDALEQTGGRLTSVAVIRTPLNIPILSQVAATSGYANLPNDPELVKRFGQRIGAGYADGHGALLGKVRKALLQSSSGSLDGVDSVVLVREPRKFEPAQQKVLDNFSDGLVKGLTVNDHTVVGVETAETKPSQVSWYRDHDVSSVDNIDELSGRAALVFTLAGADGAYGTKSSADALLPKAADTLGSLTSPPSSGGP